MNANEYEKEKKKSGKGLVTEYDKAKVSRKQMCMSWEKKVERLVDPESKIYCLTYIKYFSFIELSLGFYFNNTAM